MSRRFLVACAAALLSTAAFADNDKIDLLSGGILCDRGDQICYDYSGANLEATKRKFGEYAAKDVERKLKKKGEWGQKKFTLSNDVKCNTQNRVCKKEGGDGERAKKITNHLFNPANYQKPQTLPAAVPAPMPAPAPVAKPAPAPQPR
jgi:hypothetical protein